MSLFYSWLFSVHSQFHKTSQVFQNGNFIMFYYQYKYISHKIINSITWLNIFLKLGWFFSVTNNINMLRQKEQKQFLIPTNYTSNVPINNS